MLEMQNNNAIIDTVVCDWPKPSIVITATTMKEDIWLLSNKQNHPHHKGIIYGYVGKPRGGNNSYYIGETSKDLKSRHQSHFRKSWFENMDEILVFTVRSLVEGKGWNTDFRKDVESNIIHELSLHGLSPVNSSNCTWVDFDVKKSIESELIEAITKEVLSFVGFHLGMKLSRQRNKLAAKGINVVAERNEVTVFGELFPDGSVVITKATGIKETCNPSVKSITKERHQFIKSQSYKNKQGRYDWTGNILSEKPTAWVSAFFGSKTEFPWKNL